MLEKSLRTFIELSDALRPGYAATLGVSSEAEWQRMLGPDAAAYPEFLRHVYSVVMGTRLSEVDEWHVDFLPGYRLIHLTELPAMTLEGRSVFPEAGSFFPFLTDYSSDYVACLGDEIVSLLHDDARTLVMHESGRALLDTHCELYRVGAYRLDEGLLTCDYDVAMRVGRALNPGCSYWTE